VAAGNPGGHLATRTLARRDTAAAKAFARNSIVPAERLESLLMNKAGLQRTTVD
jgi:hypothetical protein